MWQLWLVHRKTRTMKEVLLTMDPDGSMHPSSILPEIKRQLDLSKVCFCLPLYILRRKHV
jgi:hypothetical protein